MIAFVARRCTGTLLRVVYLTRKPVPLIRPLSLTPINHNIPNMQQMMEELAKNPKAMAFLKAVKKDPKIMHAVQDLILTMSKKGYIDLKNPAKQPSLSMLADSEVRTKLFELIKLLSDAGVFNTKDGANPTEALSNIMGLLMPPSSKDKQSSLPKYNYTYDATAKDKTPRPVESPIQGLADKLKKIFK